MKADLDTVRAIGSRDRYLAVMTTVRGDGTAHGTVVNAGVLDHLLTGAEVVACVIYPGVKLHNLRRRPRATLVFRAGWEWVAVEGDVDLVGPDDPLDGFKPGDLATLLRDIFTAAGGVHEDWDEYDRVMAEEGRVAVLVTPRRVYTSG